MLISCVSSSWVFFSFYRVSWAHVVSKICPIAFCHVVLVLSNFFLMFLCSLVWTSKCSWVLHMNFKMFMDYSVWTSKCFSEFFIWTSKSSWVQYALLTCIWTCAGERKAELSLHAHALGDFAGTAQYLFPYVSSLYWIWLIFAFCILLL